MQLITSKASGRGALAALCSLLVFGCQGKQPCIGDNHDWLRVPQSRVGQISDITSEGVCTVADTPTPCTDVRCLRSADGGVNAQFPVTGAKPGNCTVSVSFSDGSAIEDAEFSFVSGPTEYCCEALCTKTVGALHPRN